MVVVGPMIRGLFFFFWTVPRNPAIHDVEGTGPPQLVVSIASPEALEHRTDCTDTFELDLSL